MKRTINWNKQQPKVLTQTENQYLYYLIDSSFLEVNRLFIIEDNGNRTGHSAYFGPGVNIKDSIIKIDGRNVFDQPVKNDVRTYENI